MIVTNNGSFPFEGSSAQGSLDGAALDRFTRETIEAQIRSGCDLVTDGLARRRDPVSHLAGHLSGVTLGDSREGFPGHGGLYRVPIATGEVAWTRPILAEDYLFARDGCAKPVKPVIVGPYTLSRIAEDRSYNDIMALAMGFAIAINSELKALQAAGAGIIQIDEPALLQFKEDFPTFTRLWEVLGRGVSARLCLHLQGGDVRGIFPGVARLKRLACLSLDGVRGRAGLEVLGEAVVPDHLQISLGLIDGSAERIESPEAIASVVRSLPGLPPSERILLGTASDLGGLAPDVAFAKLQALASARDLF